MNREAQDLLSQLHKYIVDVGFVFWGARFELELLRQALQDLNILAFAMDWDRIGRKGTETYLESSDKLPSVRVS